MQYFTKDVQHPINIATVSGDVTVCTGGEEIQHYFENLEQIDSEKEVLYFNPPGSEISIKQDTFSYKLDEAGAVVFKESTNASIHYLSKNNDEDNPVLITSSKPFWWNPYSEDIINPSGYDGNDEIGIYRLSERRDAINAKHTEWITDAISAHPPSTDGIFSIAYTKAQYEENSSDKKHLVSIEKNRPSENIHRHPDVRLYEDSLMPGVTEIYIVRSGNVGLGIFDLNQGKLHYHLLEQGDVFKVDPEDIHAVLATSEDFEYLCLQNPSCYHYPFHHNKHQFSLVSEIKERLGYDLIGDTILHITKPGKYDIENIDFAALGIE